MALTVGRLIGTANGRGIGLMFVLSGIIILLASATLYKNKAVKDLELSPPEDQ